MEAAPIRGFAGLTRKRATIFVQLGLKRVIEFGFFGPRLDYSGERTDT
jgi:hypothetical protein